MGMVVAIVDGCETGEDGPTFGDDRRWGSPATRLQVPGGWPLPIITYQ